MYLVLLYLYLNHPSSFLAVSGIVLETLLDPISSSIFYQKNDNNETSGSTASTAPDNGVNGNDSAEGVPVQEAPEADSNQREADSSSGANPTNEGESAQSGTSHQQNPGNESNNKNSNQDSSTASSESSAHTNAINQGLITFNVKNFPFIIIHIYGLGELHLDFSLILSGLSRNTRKKLAQKLNMKSTSVQDISSISPSVAGNAGSSGNSSSSGNDSVTPQQENNSNVGSGAQNNSLISDKKLRIILSGLGLPTDLSIGQMKWVFSSKSITSEMKLTLSNTLKAYTNKSSEKRKQKAQ